MGETSSGRSVLWLRAVDRMILAFLAFMAVVAAARHPQPVPVLAGVTVLAAVLLEAAALRDRFAPARWIQDFYPLPAVIIIFNVAGPLIGAANPARWDETFAALDQRLFGALVPGWRGALGRPGWLPDLASAVYVSYYLVPVVMAVALYAKGRRPEFDAAVFGFIATLLVSYVGYFLFHTTGPRVPREIEVQVLGGGALGAGVRSFVLFAEKSAAVVGCAGGAGAGAGAGAGGASRGCGALGPERCCASAGVAASTSPITVTKDSLDPTWPPPRAPTQRARCSHDNPDASGAPSFWRVTAATPIGRRRARRRVVLHPRRA